MLSTNHHQAKQIWVLLICAQQLIFLQFFNTRASSRTISFSISNSFWYYNYNVLAGQPSVARAFALRADELCSSILASCSLNQRWTVHEWEKSKDKKSSKIQPAPVLVKMFWGRFRTRSDSIKHARGRFRTRSDSIGRASQRPWTRLDEWPDPVRSRPASDTFPDPSPESDSSRFVRSLRP